MVADAILPLDDLAHTLSSPDIATKAIGFRPALQQLSNLGSLGRRETGCRTGGFAPTQGFRAATFSGLFEPLADRALGHAQGIGDTLLGPAFLAQFPGAEAAVLLHIGCLC
jgi:hypothetical protein